MSEVTIVVGEATPVEEAAPVVVVDAEPEAPQGCVHADALRADLEPRLAALELAAVIDVIEDAVEDAALEAAIVEAEAEGEETMHEEMAVEPAMETEPAPEPKPAKKTSDSETADVDSKKSTRGMSRSWFGKRAK